MNEVIQHGAVNNLMMDADAMRKIDAVAKIMAQSEVTIPKHLKNYGDSFAVAMQAAQWGMNPFAVAQKTHLVNGILGYEAQLVNAIIISRAPVTGRLKFAWEGDWSRVNGKEDKDPTRKCIVSGTFIGDDEPSTYEVSMAQVGSVRNSPLWVADPRLQLAYLTIKRWSRLYCPDVIMGVYSQDELQDDPEQIQPEKTVSGSDEVTGAVQSTTEKLKNRQSQRARPDAKKQVDEVKQTEEAKQESTTVEGNATEVVAPTETVVEAKAEEVKPTFDAAALIAKINTCTKLDDLTLCAQELTKADGLKLVAEKDKTTIRDAYVAKKTALTPAMLTQPQIEEICLLMNAATTQDDLDEIFNTKVRDRSTLIEKKDHVRLDNVHTLNSNRINPPEDDGLFGG